MEVKSLGEQGEQTQQGQQSQQGGQGAQSGASDKSRPEWLPESYFDAEQGIKLDDFGKHYTELSTAAKAEQDRLAAYPQKIEDLKFELPADLKLPEGLTLDESNPALQAFKQFAFESKMDPAVGSKLVGMYVQEQVRMADALNKRVAEEQQKLGPNAPARITALTKFFDAKVGPDLSKAVMSGVFTADQVNAFEKLMLAMSDGGTKGAPGGAREAQTNEISDEEFEKMTPRQQLEWQRQQAGGKGS